jgi:hypothetical protein
MVTDCDISENTVSCGPLPQRLCGGGGGVYCYNSNTRFANCSINGNTGGDGAGVCCSGYSPILINCSINGNSAEHGGGVSSESDLVMIGCMIIGNTAAGEGGGVRCYYDDPVLVNCTISGNSASWGGGLYGFFTNVTLTNCILWGDTLPELHTYWAPGYPGIPVITHCDIQGGWADIGNIDADPLFADAANGDYHLLPSSPCIDAGSNAAVPADVFDLDGDGNTTEPLPFDIDGNPRFNRCCPLHITLPPPGHPMPPPPPPAVVDMGAYEFKLVLPEPEAVPIDRASSVRKAGAR